MFERLTRLRTSSPLSALLTIRMLGDCLALPCYDDMLTPDPLPACTHTQPRYALERASAADSAALSVLMTETFLAAYGHVAPADRLARHISSQYGAGLIEERIGGGLIEVWVARAEGSTAAAGYLQLGLQWATPEALAGVPALEVQRCYLRPEHIGAGAADLLMQKAQQRARELGARALYLSVYQLAPRAIRFYEKHGFRRRTAIQYYIDDVAFDDWLMVWQAP